ncbi:MAG: ABC transporter substrate-binding protein [Phycisphaeraceae bacterium]|nr:ABC transporter substrate-binding protein [Phycisphaeraceae bacterium]
MIELTGITWDHPRGYEPLVAASAAYARQNAVRVTWRRRSLKDFGDASVVELADRFDLVVLDHPHVGDIATAGCLAPLDALLPDEAMESIRSQTIGQCYPSYTFAGRQWALPIDAAAQVAVMSSELNPQQAPVNWEQVEELARSSRREGRWVAWPLCPTDAVCSFLTLAAQAGVAPREDAITWPQRDVAAGILDQMRSLCSLMHPHSTQWSPIDLYEAMTAGDPIVYCPLAFGYINYTVQSEARRELRFTLPPDRADAILGGTGIGVSAGSRHIGEAAAHALWLAGGACQSGLYMQHGGQPSDRSAWEHGPHSQAQRYFDMTRLAIEQAYVRPRYPGWPAFQESAGKIIHRLLTAEADMQTTTSKLCELHERTISQQARL